MTDTRRSREHAEKACDDFDYAAKGYDYKTAAMVGIGRILLALYWQREEEREDEYESRANGKED